MSLFNLSKLNKEKTILIDPETKEEIKVKNLLKYKKNFNLDFKKKKLALILADNSISFLINYYLFLNSNYLLMLIPISTDEKDIREIIKKFKPNMIITKINMTYKNINSYKKLKIICDHQIYKSRQINNYKINKNLSLLLTTSGSTGFKKFVKISKQNLLSNTKSIIKELKIKNKDITITTLPPEYTYGLSIINTHLHVGGKIVVNNRSIIEKNFWHSLKMFNVTNFGGVPFTYDILKKLKFEKLISNLKNLKYLTQAGGKLSNSSHKFFLNLLKKHKKKFYIMYGATEATSRMSILSPNSNKIGSIGKPIYNTKMWIKKNNSKNDIGEIEFKGKNIFKGYAKSFKDLNNLKNEKILKTGDLGRKDKLGNFYIIGRQSRILKITGRRINLDELENKLLKTFKISFRITGTDDKIKIFFKGKTNLNLIINYITNKLHINKNFFITKKVKKYPLTSSGKIDYNKLNEN